MRNILPFAALALFACYSPNLSGVRFNCAGDGLPNDCPSGYSCVQGVCLLPGEQPGDLPDAGMTLSDGSMTIPPDGGAPDGSGMMPRAAGCTSMMGYDIAKDPVGAPVFACPGAFQGTGSSNATTQCASGYRVCQDANTIDLIKCSASGLQGFFIANRRGEHNSAGANVSCSPQGNVTDDHWAGCGSTSGIGLITPSSPCYGFPYGRDCVNTTASEFNCRGDDDRPLEEVISTNPVHGVLCCKI